MSANFTNLKKSNCFSTVIQVFLGKKILPFYGTRGAHSNTLKKILKYVRKSLATPGTQHIFWSQVMKYTSIESLRSKLSPAVKILSKNPEKLFLWAFEFRKNIFFLKNCKFNFYMGTNFWHKWKKCINRKLKVLAYPESENFYRNPWKTFFTGLWTFEKCIFSQKL